MVHPRGAYPGSKVITRLRTENQAMFPRCRAVRYFSSGAAMRIAKPARKIKSTDVRSKLTALMDSVQPESLVIYKDGTSGICMYMYRDTCPVSMRDSTWVSELIVLYIVQMT